MYEKCAFRPRSFDRDLYHSHALNVLFDCLEHEGILYGLPSLPRNSSFNESGKATTLDMLKGRITGDAIAHYLDYERDEALIKLKQKLHKEGLSYLLSYFEERGIDWAEPEEEE
jgi:hypothetical protein